MRAMRSTNTKPEMLLRRALWQEGLRYRVHIRVEGARPDLIFPGQRVAIFVDGCFWHGCPVHYIAPAGNAPYWREKIKTNQERDVRNNLRLKSAGWTVLRFWECELKEHLPSVVAAVVAAVTEKPPTR